MFKQTIPEGFYEVSHKRVEQPDGAEYNNHVHSYCEILLFMCGNADFNIDGTIYSPRPYDLLLIPDTKYHYLIPKAGEPYENYVLGFEKDILTSSQYDSIFSTPYVINIRADHELCGFFKRLDFYYDNYSREDFERCASLLIRELLVFLSYMPKDAAYSVPFRNKQVHDIIGIIDSHITEKLNADIIAGKLFLSRSYVQNIFSQVMHIGLMQYINQKKIFCAASDIEKGMSPSLAAEKYSFGDYSSFYRAYRKVLGSSPLKRKNKL